MLFFVFRALSDATTPGQSGPGSDGYEGVLRIPQSSNTAGTSPSDCLVSYPVHSLVGGSYPSAEKQSVYSTAPADWENHCWEQSEYREESWRLAVNQISVKDYQLTLMWKTLKK